MLKPILNTGHGESDIAAFHNEVMAARQAHGQSGLTGTLADKTSFIHLDLPDEVKAMHIEDAVDWVRRHILKPHDERIWGSKAPLGVAHYSGHGDEQAFILFGFVDTP